MTVLAQHLTLRYGAKDRGHGTTHRRPIITVTCAQLAQVVLLGPRSVDQRQGLLCLIAKVEPYDLGTGTPNFKAPRLGPRPFSISQAIQNGA